MKDINIVNQYINIVMKGKYLVLLSILIIFLLCDSTIGQIFVNNGEEANTKVNFNGKFKKISKKEIIITNDGYPDFVFDEFRVAWGYNGYYYNQNGTFLIFIVNNSGDNYYNESNIKLKIGFFADNNSEAYGITELTPFIDPKNWLSGQTIKTSYFFPLENKPELVTAKIDFINDVIESDEGNNNLTKTVPMSITIEGYVYEKVNSDLIPIKNVYITTERGSKTNESGFYSVGVIPREPINEPDRFFVHAHKQGLPFAEKTTDPAYAGDKIKLDFIFTQPPDKPKKPDGRTILLPNRKYYFSTSSIDPEGDEIFYRWNWGDNTFSDWIGPYKSGETCIVSHVYDQSFSSGIYVYAKDLGGIRSDQSEIHEITILKSREKTKNHMKSYQLFLKILNGFQNIIYLSYH